MEKCHQKVGTHSLTNEALLSRNSQLARITLERRHHRQGDELLIDGEHRALNACRGTEADRGCRAGVKRCFMQTIVTCSTDGVEGQPGQDAIDMLALVKPWRICQGKRGRG